MTIKVFISHAIEDIERAEILRKQLDASKEIEAYMYEHGKKYEDEIVKKLTDEIEESDYLIAIIAKTSASVHQEIGYAKGVGVKIIPMVKKDADKGFLIHGMDTEEFTYDNFERKCENIVKDVIKLGPRPKYDIELIEKGAHYRYEINQSIIHFLFNVIKIFNINIKQFNMIIIPRTIEDKLIIWNIIVIHFVLKGSDGIIESYKIDSELWNKLALNSKTLQDKMEKAKIYPHVNLPQIELEWLGKIQKHNKIS